MPRKKPLPDGGSPNPQSERPDGKTPKGIAINLPPEQEAQARKLSEATGITLRELRECLEKHPLVAGAITDALKRRLNAWIESKAKAGDIFAPAQEESRE